MAKSKSVIMCPKCGTEINVSDILYRQVEEELQTEYESKNARRQREHESKLRDVEAEKATLAKQKESLQHQIDSAVQQRLKTERTQLEKKLRSQIEREQSDQIEALEKELRQKSDQVKDLNKAKADVARLQREKVELKGQIEAESEVTFNKKLAEERERIKTQEKDKVQSEIQKRDKLIDDLNKRLEDAQAKLERGSNKLYGEVKEIELKEFLKIAYPTDEVRDVPSGITGADVVQLVRNRLGQPSGTILYERKQTQRFDDKWIAKLTEDGRNAKSDICVIVTKSMPSDNPETHFRNGVWVCSSNDVKIISTLLRDGLIRQYSALSSQSDKGSKVEMLYSYLISNDFKNHILGILEAFRSMDRSLQKEREDNTRKFAEREAHIFKAKQSVLNFAGRIEGIAGETLSQEIKMLEDSTNKAIEH